MLLLLASIGCEPALSDFELQIRPAVLEGQDPFATSPELKLFLDHPDGTSDILYLGSAEGGEAAFEGVPPLAAGTVVGLILEEPGGEPDGYDAQRLLAYGQVVVPDDLATGGVRSEISMLVPQYAALGGMGTLGKNQAAMAPGVAMAPGGSVYLFGGDDSPGEVGSLDRILVLRDTDAGSWSFERVEARLPEGLSALDAVAVEVDGEPRILLTGGRVDYGTSGDNSANILLFDPVTESVVWGTAKKHAKLPVGRSNHRSVRLADGSVFLYGGYTGTYGLADVATWEIFDPSTLDLRATGATATGPLGAAAASLGTSGVLTCGGGVPDPNFDRYTAVDTCALVSLQGVELPVPPLPEPVAYHAMVGLADGTVLATGGLQVTLATKAQFETGPAIAKAWRFDGTAWSEVGSMTFARAEHTLVPLPDGRVLVVGGVENTGYFYASAGPAVECTEIYDPAARAFTTVGSTCQQAGSGARPSWATVPGEDAFVLEGRVSSSMPDAFGMIGLGPDRQRIER